MKKLLRCMVLALACWLLLAGTALAAAKIDLAIDGVIVPTERTEDNTTNFYLEKRPQMRNNSVFVPVRVVSEILGAEVAWADPNINIKFGETEIVLTVGSRAAYQDGKKITLPAAPYERGGYTYVPIRFVAEAFDCDVEWQAKKNLVNIKTKPWELNGHKIVGVVWMGNMTGYAMTYELMSPYFAQRLYQIALDGMIEEVAAPADFGDLQAERFYEEEYNTTYFWLDTTLHFMIDEDTIAESVRIYSLNRGESEYKHLLRICDKWYTIQPEMLQDLIALFYTTETPRLYDYKEYKRLGQTD